MEALWSVFTMKPDTSSRSHHLSEQPLSLIPVAALSGVRLPVLKKCSMTSLLISPSVLSWFNISSYCRCCSGKGKQWFDDPRGFPSAAPYWTSPLLFGLLWNVADICVPCVTCCSHKFIDLLSFQHILAQNLGLCPNNSGLRHIPGEDMACSAD